MPSLKIDFGPRQESGYEQLAGAAPSAMNVIVDAKGAVRRRPGISASSRVVQDPGVGEEVLGLHVAHSGRVYAYFGGVTKTLYRVGPSGALHLTIPVSVSSNRPVFAETEALLLLAAGTLPTKVDLVTEVADILGGGPPPASHIVANSSRLATNSVLSNLGRVHYSALAAGSTITGHETWEGSALGSGTAGYFETEARPDHVVALHENTSELYVFGRTTLQVYAPDSAFVYSPVSTREHGCLAPYSVIKNGQTFAWLNHEKRFVLSDGRTVRSISEPIQATLDDIETVDDCFGYRVALGPVELLVWTFPTDTRTFVFQVGGSWSQWAGWDSVAGNWKRLPISAAAVAPDGGEVLIGTVDGELGRLALEASDDLGERIVCSATSGFIDRGTQNQKLCKALHLAFKRGHASSADTVLVWWRDDLGDWNGPLEASLGGTGDSDPELVFRSLGVYRRRQWKVEFSGSSELVLVAASEEFEVLEQ